MGGARTIYTAGTPQWQDEQPLSVYKYHSVNLYLYHLLINSHFYCASKKDLNDPFESKFKLSENFIRDLYTKKEKRWEKLNDFLDKELIVRHEDWEGEYFVERTIDDLIRYITSSEKVLFNWVSKLTDVFDLKVCSFTADKSDDIYMWSHYTNNYNGVKLKFDFSNNKLRFRHVNTLHAINYSDFVTFNDYYDICTASLFKLKVWESQREYRILNANHFTKWSAECLKEIVFGHNVSSLDKNSIFKVCNLLGYKCEFFELELNYSGFSRKVFEPSL